MSFQLDPCFRAHLSGGVSHLFSAAPDLDLPFFREPFFILFLVSPVAERRLKFKQRSAAGHRSFKLHQVSHDSRFTSVHMTTARQRFFSSLFLPDYALTSPDDP